MNLTTFLATANADHVLALQEAQAYTVAEPKMYTANVMTVMMVGAGVYGVLSDTAQDANSPVRDICLALMDRLRSEGEFNLSASDPMGQANIQMLDGLIAGLPDYAAQLTDLKAQLIAGAEEVRHPFANISMYILLRARNAVPEVPVAHNEQGFVIVNATTNCPDHSPVIFGLNPRTSKPERVGFLRNVAAAGKYECRIAHENRGWTLTLEDAYGVFGE